MKFFKKILKINDGFLDMMGFDNTQDFIGLVPNFKLMSMLTISFGSIVAFVEAWTGISVMLWVFLTLASIFDIIFGIYANIIILGNDFVSKKFFRGIFKSFIVLFIIVITNSLHLGVSYSNINPDFLKVTFEYMSATIHYSFVMLISLYLLSGISENGAKIDIPVFVSLSRMLKLKIKKVENIGEDIIVIEEEVITVTEESTEEVN